MAKPHTEAELLQIAEDIFKNRVFTDRHLRDKSLLSSVFMVLALADEKTMNSIKKINPGMIYEYMDKAGLMAINGYPIFASVRFLDQEDSKKVWSIVEKMEEAMKIVKECADPPAKEKK